MPRSKRDRADPTRQAANRAKAYVGINIRLMSARRAIITRFRAVPYTRRTEAPAVNASEVVYRYDLTPEQEAQLLREVQADLDSEILETQGDTPPPDWWWKGQVEPPHRQGAMQGTVQFNQAIVAAAILGFTNRAGQEPQPVPVELALTTQSYRQGLQRTYQAGFASLSSLSDTTAAQVGRVITNGMHSGQTPTEITGQIIERFSVAQSSARRTADTAINAAYNNARMEAAVAAADPQGLTPGVIHTSALLPTTRETHADRHGNAYTVSDQLAWWESDGNRYNCHCSTRSVLLDDEGRVINADIQEEIQAERPSPPASVSPAPTEQAPVAPIRERPVRLPIERPIDKPKTTTESIKVIKKAKPSKKIANLKKSNSPVKVVEQKLAPSEAPPKLNKVKLKSDESAYVEHYKGDGFYKSNEILRNPSAFSSAEVESAGKMRDSINSAIMRSELQTDGVLYRGIRSKEVFADAENLIGKRIPIHTPQSTATSAGSAVGWSGLLRGKEGVFYSSEKEASVVLKIRTKKGQHGLDLESLSMGNTGEREILLGSGGGYRVTGVKHLTDDAGKVTGKVLEVEYDE